MGATIMQKLIESSNSIDIEKMRETSIRIAVPSIMGKLSFDNVRRIALNPQLNTQLNKQFSYNIVNAGFSIQPSIFPLPKWFERSYNPQYYETSQEITVAIINSIALFYLIMLMGLVVIYKNVTNTFNIVLIILFYFIL
jgi:hypothetical protein